MIKSLSIRNFRCFREADLQDLRRVNIIVGKNATGKTALLESIFLAVGGSPAVALRLRNFRGMGQKIEGDADTLSGIWKELGGGFSLNDPINITIFDTEHDRRALTISSTGGAAKSVIPTAPEDTQSVVPPVQFTWTTKRGQIRSLPKFTPQGLAVDEVPSDIKIAFFPANYSLDPEETSRRLSDFRKRGGQAFLLDTVKSVFGDVTDISSETNIGTWLVHVSVKGLESMIPLALHSAGASRFVAYLVGIAAMRKGAVLIDELENGFYYKTFPQAWDALLKFAERSETQLFVTTHSEECLQGVRKLVHEQPEQFALIRATKDVDERTLECFSGDRLAGALESGFELR